jgi:MFS family permease
VAVAAGIRSPHAVHVTTTRAPSPARLHYAWVVVAVAFVGLLTAQGARLSFGAFIGPWQNEFGTSRGSISLISTVSFLVYGVTQPLAGRLVDRVGTRVVLSGSAALVGVGLALAATARSPLHLALTYGVLASIGFGGASQVVASVAVTEWFIARRGLVFAVVEAAYGAGQILVVPAALALVTTAGWRPTLLVLAGLAAVLAAPVMLVLLRSRPADKGLEPYGGASVLVAEEAPDGPAAPERVRRPPLSALLKRREFWGLALPFFVCGYTTTGMIDTHLIPLAHDHGYGTATTGAAVGVLAVFNVLGTLASGPLADRYDSRLILAGLYGMRAVTLVLLLFTHSTPALLVFSLTFGLVDFATVAPTQVLASRWFRGHSLGLVFGLIFLAHQVGSAVGAYVPGALHDVTGSYDLALLGGVAVLVLATLTSAALPDPRRGTGAATTWPAPSPA